MAKTLIDKTAAADQLVAARAQLWRTLHTARRELAPAQLTRRASDRAKAELSAQVKARPVASGLIAAGVVALLLRKPLAGLARHFLRTK